MTHGTRESTGDAIAQRVRDAVQTNVDTTLHSVIDEVTGLLRQASLGRAARGLMPSWSRIGVSVKEGRATTYPGTPAAPIEVEETDEGFTLLFDVLGWSKNELTVRATPTSVRVRGKTAPAADATKTGSAETTKTGSIEYEGLWTSPSGVELDPASAQGRVADGVLKVIVNKAAGHSHPVKLT